MFADGGVLGKARLRGGDTASQHRLNVDLNPSTKVLHFLIGLGPVRLLARTWAAQSHIAPYFPEYGLDCSNPVSQPRPFADSSAG